MYSEWEKNKHLKKKQSKVTSFKYQQALVMQNRRVIIRKILHENQFLYLFEVAKIFNGYDEVKMKKDNKLVALTVDGVKKLIRSCGFSRIRVAEEDSFVQSVD
jgi:hypothetical protein